MCPHTCGPRKRPSRLKVKRGEVHYVDFGPPSDGSSVVAERHYAVVLQRDELNDLEGYQVVVVVPLTSKDRSPRPPTLLPVSGSDYAAISSAHKAKLSSAGFAQCQQVLSIPTSWIKEPAAG